MILGHSYGLSLFFTIMDRNLIHVVIFIKVKHSNYSQLHNPTLVKKPMILIIENNYYVMVHQSMIFIIDNHDYIWYPMRSYTVNLYTAGTWRSATPESMRRFSTCVTTSSCVVYSGWLACACLCQLSWDGPPMCKFSLNSSLFIWNNWSKGPP